MESYRNLDDAVFYASQAAREIGANKREFISLVYQTPGGEFRFVAPQGGKSNRYVKQKLAYPKDAKLMAIVHNHPGADEVDGYAGMHSAFSPDDIQMARTLKLPSYIVFGRDMSMRRFDPAKDSPSVREGQPFNHIPEVQPAGNGIGDAIKQLLLGSRP